MSECQFCNPEYYIVYGVCRYCGVQTREPLQNFPFDRVKAARYLAESLNESQKHMKRKKESKDE